MGKDVLELGEYDTPVQKLHEEHGVSEAPHCVDVAGHELDACVPGRAHLSGRLECIVHTTVQRFNHSGSYTTQQRDRSR